MAGKARLALVPTAYPDLDENRIRRLEKVAMVMYGNHAIRAAVAGMQAVFARIRADGGIREADQSLVSVDEIFRLHPINALSREPPRQT